MNKYNAQIRSNPWGTNTTLYSTKKSSIKYYCAPRGWGSFTPERVSKRINETAVCIDEHWMPARPDPYRSFWERLLQAWDVLTYKADALYWGRKQ